MAAAWPYCDAIVSAHNFEALDDLLAALRSPSPRRLALAPVHPDGTVAGDAVAPAGASAGTGAGVASRGVTGGLDSTVASSSAFNLPITDPQRHRRD